MADVQAEEQEAAERAEDHANGLAKVASVGPREALVAEGREPADRLIGHND